MPREPSTSERLASLETHIQHLLGRISDTDASLKQTTLEFRVALEKHREEHRAEKKESADTRWKIISAVIAVMGIGSSVVFALLGKFVF